jgi:hypothetical protein
MIARLTASTFYFSDVAIVWLERKFNELYWKEAIGV